MFAVVAEGACDDGERDARVVAWGMAYPDGRARVVGEDSHQLLALRSAERAVWWFTRFTGWPVRLMWVDAAPA